MSLLVPLMLSVVGTALIGSHGVLTVVCGWDGGRIAILLVQGVAIKHNPLAGCGSRECGVLGTFPQG